MENQVQQTPNQGTAARRKHSLIMLAICLALILIATVFGSLIQTAGWTYTTKDLRDATNTGTIWLTPDGAAQANEYTVTGKVVSGTLFKPVKADAGTRPAIVLSHGLYNNREMQLQNAIELVRRGYVVMVIDQQRHGHNAGGSNEFMGFYSEEHLNAAKYLYNLPEVDKSKVAVSGHSMGGASTAQVLNYDGRYPGTQTDANFKAGHFMGIVSAYLVQANEAPTSIPSNVIAVGVVKGIADEFFFQNNIKTADYIPQHRGVVTEYNYDDGTYYLKKGDDFVLQTSEDKFKETAQYYKLTTEANTAYYLQGDTAYTFTRGTAPTADDDWNTVNGGIYANGTLIAQPEGNKLVSVAREGEALASTTNSLRAVYQANETHPMNHFSTKTAAHVIDFFYNAFGVTEGYNYKAPTNQTWWLKEVFAVFGIIGLFAMLLPILDLLLETKLFASLKGEPAEAPILLTRPRKHVSYWLAGILTTIFGAVSFHNLVDGQVWYNRLGLKDLLDNVSEGFIYTNMGKMAAWGIICAVFAIIVVGLIWLVNHIINVVKYGDDFAAHDEKPFAGFQIRSVGNILKTVGVVVILVALFYGLVNFIWYTTRVQMQVWVFGPRVFKFERIASMLKYVPFFAIYYVTMAALAQGYRVKDLPEWATIAINVVFNVAGVMIMIWVANSYFINNGAMIQTTSTPVQFGNSMHYIHGFPMIPSIAIATVLARRIYVRTGNAWLAGLLNATLMTIIGCANTSIAGAVAWVYGA